jgi:hypothetical protein
METEKTITLDKEKLNSIIEKLEEERDEYYRSSAEYIEKDEIINSILKTIMICKVRNSDS